MSQKKQRVYKTPIGAIPKIVNNFKPKTLNQRVFYDIISEEQTQIDFVMVWTGTGKTYVSIYKGLSKMC